MNRRFKNLSPRGAACCTCSQKRSRASLQFREKGTVGTAGVKPSTIGRSHNHHAITYLHNNNVVESSLNHRPRQFPTKWRVVSQNQNSLQETVGAVTGVIKRSQGQAETQSSNREVATEGVDALSRSATYCPPPSLATESCDGTSGDRVLVRLPQPPLANSLAPRALLHNQPALLSVHQVRLGHHTG